MTTQRVRVSADDDRRHPWTAWWKKTLVVFAFSCSSAMAESSEMWPGVPEATSPLEVISIPGQGNYAIRAVVRRPPGDDLKPVVILIHGSWDIWPAERLKEISDRPLISFFLAGGYVTVAATTRRFQEDPQSDLPQRDCLSIVEYVKGMPGIDPNSIAVYGESGGGSFVLELARKSNDIVAVGVHEPASVIFNGLFTKEIGGQEGRALAAPIIENPEKYYTEGISRLTMEKVKEIRCPLYIQHGDHAIRKMHYRFFLPDVMSAAEQRVVISVYPGMPHPLLHRGGVRWSRHTFEDLNLFFKQYLKVEPHPIAGELIEWQPDLEDAAQPMTLERYLRRQNQ